MKQVTMLGGSMEISPCKRPTPQYNRMRLVDIVQSLQGGVFILELEKLHGCRR